MHLLWERSIQIPGSFVILQGIPGDGLLNTIDSSPDFGLDCDDVEDGGGDLDDDGDDEENVDTATSTTTIEPASHQTLASPSAFGTFLGQGIPSLLLPSGAAAAISAASPSSLATTPQQQSLRQMTTASTAAPDDFVFINDDVEDNANDERPRQQRNATTLPSHVQRSINLWNDECVALQTNEAKEWLASVQQQQRTSSTRKLDSVPILSRLQSLAPPTSQNNNNPRWWLDAQTAQLCVFSILPCPIPSIEEENVITTTRTLPPGTTVVGIALHTFDLKLPPRSSHTGIAAAQNAEGPLNGWTYQGQCTNFQGEDPAMIPKHHVPRAGRIQYLHIESPVQGYLVFSVDGYAVLAPGLPNSSFFTGHVADGNDNNPDASLIHLSRWWWKVTCHEGAVVRQGVDLHTPVLSTLPYGTHVQVLRKVVNAVGLSRLLVRAHCYEKGQVVDGGWCSEYLNPMAGQRGPILQPVPMAVPALYQIRQPCTVRAEIELSSAQVARLDPNENSTTTVVPALRRIYTEFPAQNCVPRLQLAPGAYASVRLNTLDDDPTSLQSIILHPTGEVDGSFDPDSPGVYHWHVHKQWKRRRRSAATPNTTYLSGASSLTPEPVRNNPPISRNIPHSPSCSAAAASSVTTTAADLSSVESSSSSSSKSSSSASRTASSQQQVLSLPPPPQRNLCMCCEDKVVNATLVHGQTGHICVCLDCGRILLAKNLPCPICRLAIDNVILHFYS